MKQRTPGTHVASGVQLEKDDFLTGENLKPESTLQQTPPNVNQIAPPQPIPMAGNDIPDLHNIEESPNKDQREQIANNINQQISPKIKTVEDQIQQDIAEAQQQKFTGVPKTPKEVLKSLIAKGEYKEDFQIFGQKWTLRALDQSDTLLSLDEVDDSFITQSGKVISLMFGTVIYSIDAINDVSIYEWFEDIKLSDYGNNRLGYNIAVRKALKRYLEAMPPTVIDTLYDKYLELDTRRNEGMAELKNF